MLLTSNRTKASYYSSIISVSLIPVVLCIFLFYHGVLRKRNIQYHRLSFRAALGISLSSVCHSICQILMSYPGLMQHQTSLQLRVLLWFLTASNLSVVLFMSFLMVYVFLTVVTKNEEIGYKSKHLWGPEITVLSVSLLISHPILYIYHKVDYLEYIRVNGKLPWYQKDWWGLEFTWIVVGLVVGMVISVLLRIKVTNIRKSRDQMSVKRISSGLLITCIIMWLTQIWPLICNLQGHSGGLYGFAMVMTNLSGLLVLVCLLITIEPFKHKEDDIETEVVFEEKPLNIFAPLQASNASTIHLSPYQSRH